MAGEDAEEAEGFFGGAASGGQIYLGVGWVKGFDAILEVGHCEVLKV